MHTEAIHGFLKLAHIKIWNDLLLQILHVYFPHKICKSNSFIMLKACSRFIFVNSKIVHDSICDLTKW